MRSMKYNMKTFTSRIAFITVILSAVLTQSCKDKAPSVAKIFVRSQSNELLADARVVVIAAVNDNESNIEYVDTLLTNSSGFAEFNLQDYYSKVGKSVSVATFDVVCRKLEQQGVGKIRTRVNTTAVETIRIMQ
jgi:hypothetical protein